MLNRFSRRRATNLSISREELILFSAQGKRRWNCNTLTKARILTITSLMTMTKTTLTVGYSNLTVSKEAEGQTIATHRKSMLNSLISRI